MDVKSSDSSCMLSTTSFVCVQSIDLDQPKMVHDDALCWFLPLNNQSSMPMFIVFFFNN
jgi:hypothetical protein